MPKVKRGAGARKKARENREFKKKPKPKKKRDKGFSRIVKIFKKNTKKKYG